LDFARAASLILLFALGAIPGYARGAVMIELKEAATGQPVTTEVGERLRISLPENVTTGYRWQVGGDCAAVLNLEDDQTSAAAGPPGAVGKRVLVFAAKAEGHCELRLEYARAWEKTVTGKTLTFPITVRRGG